MIELREDFEQIVAIGFFKVIDCFDFECGIMFVSFAVLMIFGEFCCYFCDRIWVLCVLRVL